MSKPKIPQGRRLIEHLKRRPFSYLEMGMLGISTCSWRRISEQLYQNERIIKTKGNDGLIRWKMKTIVS